mmetsp:Transcript_34293/g.105550  ORF Transcript_34293/g.105550 Transcript_34293/m.105550 type:complete len:217 (+) Transcript_34293:808-1458(+)
MPRAAPRPCRRSGALAAQWPQGPGRDAGLVQERGILRASQGAVGVSNAGTPAPTIWHRWPRGWASGLASRQLKPRSVCPEGCQPTPFIGLRGEHLRCPFDGSRRPTHGCPWRCTQMRTRLRLQLLQRVRTPVATTRGSPGAAGRSRLGPHVRPSCRGHGARLPGSRGPMPAIRGLAARSAGLSPRHVAVATVARARGHRAPAILLARPANQVGSWR